MINVSTRYTEAGNKEFFLFHMFQHKYYKAARIILPTAILLIFIDAILMCAIRNYFLGAYCAVFGISGIGIIISRWVTYKKHIKNATVVVGAENIFEFDDEYIKIRTTGDAADGESMEQYEYDEMYTAKAYETDKAFYFYISPVQAYFLSKEDFTEGTPEDLRNLLKSKLGAKNYIICK